MKNCCLRKAEWKDKELLYEWRNDSLVRKVSFQQKEISMPEHEKWLREKLKNTSSDIYILDIGGNPAGQVRVDREGKEAQVSYSIASSFRGQGYGRLMLQLLEHELEHESLILVGQVKKENAASQVIFRSLGYKEFEKENFFEYRKTDRFDSAKEPE